VALHVDFFGLLLNLRKVVPHFPGAPAFKTAAASRFP
jgi:hypothetical protein